MMNHNPAISVLLLTLLGASAIAADLPMTGSQQPPVIHFEPYQFEARSGETVAAERGTLTVPENRDKPDSSGIELGFVRFKASVDQAGPPIIYLAGGPGGSGTGTAQGRRFPLFMAMREFGDVIAFDQRGTGLSNHIPECRTQHRYPLDEPLTMEKALPRVRQATEECAAFWREAGVDLAAYNTLESARDLDALRRGLGVDKVSLWGISYGSHLALAAVKVMPDHIDRMVLTGIEGLDQTVKLPARTDQYFSRLQKVIDQDPGASTVFPDLAGLMKKVHAQLEAEPIRFTVQDESGQDVTMAIGKTEMQLMASFSIADPAGAANLPGMYALAARGDASHIGGMIYQYLRRDPVSFRGMPEAMDIASGISRERLEKVRQQAESSLLGDLLNYPMPQLIGAFGLNDLGEDFRSPVTSAIPTLVLTSTLDGRTYPEAAAETMAGFGNAAMVTVHNGGHNVFMQSPKITEMIQQFMRGQEVPAEITLPPPTFRF